MQKLLAPALICLLSAPALAGGPGDGTGLRVRPIGVRVTTQAAVFDRITGDARTLGIVQEGQVYVLLRTDIDATGQRVRIRFSNEDGWIDKAALVDVPDQPIYVVAALPSLPVGGGHLDNGVLVAPVSGSDTSQRQIYYAGQSAMVDGGSLRGPIDRDNPFDTIGRTSAEISPIVSASLGGQSAQARLPEGVGIDPKTGLAVDRRTGLPIDKHTGLPFDPKTGKLIDPKTGKPIANPAARQTPNAASPSPGGGAPSPPGAPSSGTPSPSGGAPMTGPQQPGDLGSDVGQADTKGLNRAGRYVELPKTGTGFKTYGKDDRRWGTEKMIAGIMRAGAHWVTLPKTQGQARRAPVFEVGDISKKGGGKISGHVSHQRGVDADVRPARNDGQNGQVTIDQGAYSSPFTAELIQLFRKYAPVTLVLFNDARVPGVRKWPNHSNHFHVRISG